MGRTPPSASRQTEQRHATRQRQTGDDSKERIELRAVRSGSEAGCRRHRTAEQPEEQTYAKCRQQSTRTQLPHEGLHG